MHPLYCARAANVGDCPVGHDWGTDPSARLPLHHSLRSHQDALEWAKRHPVAPPPRLDPYDVYGTPEHEYLLMREEGTL